MLSLCRVEVVKRLPLHRYSVDFNSYSGPLGISGSDGKQNTMRIVALSINCQEQT